MRKIINRLFFRIKNQSTKLGFNVHISRYTQVGKNCRIEDNSKLSKNVKLSNNVKIGAESVLTNITIGDNTMLESGIKMPGTGKGNIIIGKECYIGINNILDTSDNIIIGNFVHIAGPSTALWCHSSARMCINGITLDDPNRDKFRFTAPIIIEDNVYIGGNCTVYPGVVIQHHSVVAPNSVVSKNVEPFTMVGGVPAKEIKRIQNEK